MSSVCKDFEPDCRVWAARGECGLNPYFMRRQCKSVSQHQAYCEQQEIDKTIASLKRVSSE